MLTREQSDAAIAILERYPWFLAVIEWHSKGWLQDADVIAATAFMQGLPVTIKPSEVHICHRCGCLPCLCEEDARE